MAQGDPYARLIQSMRRQGAYKNGYDMEIGTVTARNPVSIRLGEVQITEGIYCNALTSANMDEELEEILREEKQISDRLKKYLNDSYKAARVDVGDKVLVQRVGNSFFICGKVEAI